MLSLHLVSALALIIGSTVMGGMYVARKGDNIFQSDLILNFVAMGAGLLLGLCFTEFLPEALEHGGKLAPLMVFAGVVVVVFMERYIAPRIKFFREDPHHKHSEGCGHSHAHHLISHKAACSAVGCLLVCAFFDGMQIKVAFDLSNQAGWLTSLGLMVHILPDGALAATLALAGGMGKSAAKGVSLVTGGAMFLGVLTAGAVKLIFGFQHYLLPLASGVLLYVSFVHLLPMALRAKRGFFFLCIGGLAIIVIHGYGFH